MSTQRNHRREPKEGKLQETKGTYDTDLAILSMQKKLYKEFQSPQSAPGDFQTFKGHSPNFKGHLQLYPKRPLRGGAWSSNPARAGSPSINSGNGGQRNVRSTQNDTSTGGRTERGAHSNNATHTMRMHAITHTKKTHVKETHARECQCLET